ncbi:MAG TPA: IS1595 family transposase [Bacteroidia bacterium]|jgi:transposase-like protein|nr:IS1595 family transposase [Bacteroidia bacterium]
MNFIDFQNKFKNDDAIINHFIKIRYGNKKPACNHCGSFKVHQRPKRHRIFQCNDCNKDFSIFKGTIFEQSTTDLRKWFYAIRIFLNGKKGISGLQLEREINVTYKTAWRMLKQIRLAMGNESLKGVFDNILEMDETYIGGKPRKGPNGKFDIRTDKSSRGRGTFKIPIIGVKDREKKLIYARVALPNEKNQTLTGQQLLNVLNDVAKAGSTIMTDQFRSYRILSKYGYVHLKLDHDTKFVDGIIHTNGLESFWSIFKRGVYGVYHSVSRKHLQKYVNEFTFRYNNKDNAEIFDLVLSRSILA